MQLACFVNAACLLFIAIRIQVFIFWHSHRPFSTARVPLIRRTRVVRPSHACCLSVARVLSVRRTRAVQAVARVGMKWNVVRTRHFVNAVCVQRFLIVALLVSSSYGSIKRFEVSYKKVRLWTYFHFPIFVPQRTTKSARLQANSSCDLLSFSYLCATKNNPAVRTQGGHPVVICFHFLIFVLQRTTIMQL